MKIFLIRHGESICNTGENYTLGIPDHKIHLTANGQQQAHKSAKYLIDYLINNNINMEKSRMWVSPYERTRETSKIFNKHLKIEDVKEHINIVEQQYGLFDSLPYEEWGIRYPNEFAHYQKCNDHDGKFWARFPMGESVFDVAIRVHNFFGTVIRDYEKKGIDTLFIITHGTTLRTFVMQWLNYPPEWFQVEKTPHNCWIRLLDDKEDKGYIYNGM
jgi:2,3-bisphosphoglycerate-dependent phosphoglycerate mutase